MGLIVVGSVGVVVVVYPGGGWVDGVDVDDFRNCSKYDESAASLAVDEDEEDAVCDVLSG